MPDQVPDCDRHNSIEDPPGKLDAYGHLLWTVGTVEEGKWMACFDAIYDKAANQIEYHVVVDGGSFVDTPEKGPVPIADANELKCLPGKWHWIGVEQGLVMDEKCLTLTSESWATHINELISNASSLPIHEDA